MKKIILLSILIIVGCEEPAIEGCLDGQATNYDATASIDNNTCTYVDSCGVIDIDKTNDCIQDDCGVWGGDGVDADSDNICDDVDACIVQDGVSVELWGECYDIETTTSLFLNHIPLTGSIPPEIGNLTNLTYLDLSGNHLTGEIPSEIGNLTNLETLYLHYQGLTGSIPPEIGNLTNLTDLNICFTQLTGAIPSEIGNLTNLTNLDLSHIHLTGAIPSEIGNLTNLTDLHLGGNDLTGEIPPEIGNLNNLTYLGLNSNQLTGEIPEEICNQGDSSPSLSNNQLCPPYPSCIEDYVGEQDTSNCP